MYDEESMTDAIDQLLTIAEMGAAFAGFTAIAGVLASDSRARAKAKINFWIMIEFSFALIAFSLLPIVLFNFELSDATVWKISSTLMAVFIPVHLLTVGRLIIFPAVQRGEFDRRAPWIFVPLFAIIFLVQASNGFGIGFEHTFPAYFLGLTFFILLVFTNFVGLLAEFWTTGSQAGA